MRKFFPSSVVLLIVVLAVATSCKSYEMGAQMNRVELAPIEYDVVGSVRVEGLNTSNKSTYDGLLKAAREKYGEDVDVINIKTDKMSKKGLIFKKKVKSYMILNAHVIKYKNKK